LVTQAASFNITASTTTAYYVKAVSERGCTVYDSVRLTVYPYPSLTVQDVAICGSGTVTVAATTANPSDALSWYRDANYTNVLPQAGSFTFTATADTAFYVKATAGGLCSVYDSVRVAVSSYSTISVREDTSLCAGLPVSIYASTPNSTDLLSWYSDAQHTNLVTQSHAFDITATTTTTYYVKVVSDNGCTSSDKVQITVFPLPVLTTGDTTVCAGASIVLSATTANSADTLRWYADAYYSSLLMQARTFTTLPLSFDTTFYVEASGASGGCRTRNSLRISVVDPPNVVAMDSRRICYGEEVTLSTKQSDGDIQWNVNNTVMRPTATGHYVVTASRYPCPEVRDTVTITVGEELYILPDILPPYRRNVPYAQELTTNATPPVFSLIDGQLPAGIRFLPAGALEGLPFRIEYNDAGYPFRIQVTDEYGCVVIKEYKLTGGFFIPEVFSPNGDGINEHFMKGLRVIIFDRLGRKLFEGVDGWDGTHNGRTVPEDVYFYILYYLEEGIHEIQKTGFITVVK
jgi:gliding motility-associated-like protein